MAGELRGLPQPQVFLAVPFLYRGCEQHRWPGASLHHDSSRPFFSGAHVHDGPRRFSFVAPLCHSNPLLLLPLLASVVEPDDHRVLREARSRQGFHVDVPRRRVQKHTEHHGRRLALLALSDRQAARQRDRLGGCAKPRFGKRSSRGFQQRGPKFASSGRAVGKAQGGLPIADSDDGFGSGRVSLVPSSHGGRRVDRCRPTSAKHCVAAGAMGTSDRPDQRPGASHFDSWRYDGHAGVARRSHQLRGQLVALGR
mmetsp:Transcript_103936/g.293146  ORF Transcript_103936/g.293146 Transcript_103936/m.293146 type:complete len:254 (+) Transcript_103936:780-1541(+)